MERKGDVMRACGAHRNWEDYQLDPLEYLMRIYTIEDLWDDITNQTRSVLLSTWREELEMLGAELTARREINGLIGLSRGCGGDTGSAMMVETTVSGWLERGLELIGNPSLGFDPDFLCQGYPYHTGDTVGDLKACMVRCLLRECERKLWEFFRTRPRMVGSVEARRLRLTAGVFQ